MTHGTKLARKFLAREDVPRFRRILAQGDPVERYLHEKWESVAAEMGSVPVAETIRGLKVVLFLAKKIESILVDEVAYRGHKDTDRALSKVREIERDSKEMLTLLGG